MYVYLCICMHMYTYICMCVYRDIHNCGARTHTHTYIHTRAYRYVRCPCMHVWESNLLAGGCQEESFHMSRAPAETRQPQPHPRPLRVDSSAALVGSPCRSAFGVVTWSGFAERGTNQGYKSPQVPPASSTTQIPTS